MAHIVSAVNVVIPVFVAILVGFLLRYKKMIDEAFVGMAMKLVFNVGLPGMLFTKVSGADMSILVSGNAGEMALFVFVTVTLMFFIARGTASFVVKDEASRGTFVQGAFRSNFIIIGSSVLFSLFGDASALLVAIVTVIVVPYYNVLAIWVLSEESHKHPLQNLFTVAQKVARNPLIIAILLGFIASALKLQLPIAVTSTIKSLGAMGTPLGLIGIGAYMDLKNLSSIKESLVAVGFKIVIFPLLMTVLAILFGFGYMETCIVFILFASPTAISSFIMATAMGGNSRMAANIVIISTGLSLMTYIIGLSTLAMYFS